MDCQEKVIQQFNKKCSNRKIRNEINEQKKSSNNLIKTATTVKSEMKLMNENWNIEVKIEGKKEDCNSEEEI